MPFHSDSNLLPLRLCPRIDAEDYILLIKTRWYARFGVPIVASCEPDETGAIIFVADGERVDETTVAGWIDYWNDAIDDGQLALAEIAALKETILDLKLQLESRQRQPDTPILAFCKHGNMTPRAAPNGRDEIIDKDSSRAPVPSKREARMLKKIFLDATP